MSRPIVLDLFCAAGGAGRGYHDAGFRVIGCDSADQPRYPYEWFKGDVFQVFEYLVTCYRPALIHASPSCRDHTFLTSVAGTDGTKFQLATIRKMLQSTGLPYVLENVMGADMTPDLVLCGEMFGLRTIRHRQFEIGGFTVTQPRHPAAGEVVAGVRCDRQGHRRPTATKRRRERWAQGWHVSITGDVGTYVGPEAMGIDWMTGNELSLAIPPAYTAHIGAAFLATLAVPA